MEAESREAKQLKELNLQPQELTSTHKVYIYHLLN